VPGGQTLLSLAHRVLVEIRTLNPARMGLPDKLVDL
jgi:hypothetical protein